VQSLLQNLVKLSQVSTKKGNGALTSTSECLNTMKDTDDEEDLIEPSMAFLAYTENIADEEAQDYDSTSLSDDNVEYNATLSQMEVEGVISMQFCKVSWEIFHLMMNMQIWKLIQQIWMPIQQM
jgi:hypothetical protein